MKKLIMIAALMLCPLLCLCACTSYRNDVAVSDISSAVLNAVSTQGGYAAMESDYVSIEFSKPDVIDSNVQEWMILASSSQSTVDEFGIFRVKEGGDTNAVKAEVEDYVQYMQVKLEVYLEMYDPAEKTKLENAKVTVLGNYVVFTMLTEADTDACMDAIKGALSN